MTFISVKRSVDCMIEKLNISKHSRSIVKHQPLPIRLLQLDTILSGIRSSWWDHFEILATGRSDIHCRMKESLLIEDLKPSLNENVGSEKLFLYQPFIYFPADFDRSVFYQFFTIVLIRFQSFALAYTENLTAKLQNSNQNSTFSWVSLIGL